jgi:hypothetical protein
VRRTFSGAFGGPRPRRRLPWAVALGIAIVVSACTPAAIEPKFSLSIRNAGEMTMRLKVVVASEGTPSRDLLIPAKSGILQTEERAMDVKDGKADPVVVEVYTDTCALIASVTVGEGRTRVAISEDLSVTTAGGAPDSSGAVEPELVPACSPSS